MKPITLIFSLAEDRTPPVIIFAVGPQGVWFELGSQSVDDFVNDNHLTRHEVFDWAVGDAGKKAVLLEWPRERERTLNLKTAQGPVAIAWLNFKEASRQVTEGQQRRFLQLAVQFIANGGKLDESVLASAVDEEILQKMREQL